MAGKLKLLRHLGVSLAILLGLSCLSTALGQSGRRTSKPKTVVAPVQDRHQNRHPGRQSRPSPPPDSFSAWNIPMVSGASL